MAQKHKADPKELRAVEAALAKFEASVEKSAKQLSDDIKNATRNAAKLEALEKQLKSSTPIHAEDKLDDM